MSVIDDLRKLIQDLVAPDLKAIQEQIRALDAKVDHNQLTLMNALNIDKRLALLEQTVRGQASPPPQ